MGLDLSPGTPLLGMVTRLVNQKGLDILAQAMPELMKKGVGMVVLGVGQKDYQDLCLRWATEWPGRFACKLGFDTQLAHQIEAGADIYLMPSRFEPCGLNQLYSLRYGTLPVVHATGGLEDTVVDIPPDGATGTGFKFRTYTPEGLLNAVNRALAVYAKPDAWRLLIREAMRQDFSWTRAADEYIGIYRRLLS